MAEYIEREAALKESIEVFHWCGYEDRYDDFVPVDAIKRIPAADVAPVRYGRWIAEPDGGTRCSACDKRVRVRNGGGYEPVDLSELPYCPKCGARMDKEEMDFVGGEIS